MDGTTPPSTIQPLPLPDRACRTAVEDAMNALVDALVEQGLMRPAIALALADASEDLAIRMARTLPANTNSPGEAGRP